MGVSILEPAPQRAGNVSAVSALPERTPLIAVLSMEIRPVEPTVWTGFTKFSWPELGTGFRSARAAEPLRGRLTAFGILGGD